MANVFDYLAWRGDLTFHQDPPNAIDALVFSTIAYIRFDSAIREHPEQQMSLPEVWQLLSSQPDYLQRGRNRNDIDLLKAASETRRFGTAELVYYRDEFIPEQDTQFAAVTFLLEDGSAFLAFRGTDNTLTGWKEDLNMSYQHSVPSQRLALEYTTEILNHFSCSVRLCGHSKGGNLAVYAAAKSLPAHQNRILDVYNQDGPGFIKHMLEEKGYLDMVPRIHTYVPQSSVIGLLMEHAEPYTIIRSNQISLLQHDTFNWEVIGKEFIPVECITPDSRFLDATIDHWLDEMDLEERGQWVDAVFSVLTSSESELLRDVFQPKNFVKFLKKIGDDENTHKVLLTEWIKLMDAAKQTRERR